MDLRRRTTHVLAAAGALLIVGSLSLGAGVAVAASRPAADDDRATTTSSKPKKQKAKKADNDKPANDKPANDKPGKPTTTTTMSRKPAKSTGTTATTTATTKPPATTAPPTTSTTGAPKTAPHQVDPATEPSTDGSTPDPGDGSGGDDPGAPEPATKQPTARSGSGGLPPGMYPGPGSRVANSTPSATSAPATATTATTPPVSVAPADTEPEREGSGTVSEAGVSDPETNPQVDPSVGGAGLDRGESPAAPARRSRQLGQTGDGTRRLVLLGGVTLLLGALVVAFTGRDRPEAETGGQPAGPGRRRPRPRRELDGWEDGVPLAPAKRELARHRLGISASGRAGDGLPGAGPGA
ncbi:MAG TPA: hypothetical protein VFS16_10915 [Acidimicrobiia bacterium]|nr:hypothetical protein [Acidimicrobiia bacterium]